MASIQSHRGKWHVQVYAGGRRASKVFATRKEAAAWALTHEAELSGKRLPDKTLKDALVRYAAEVSPTHRGERWERVRLQAMQQMPLAGRKLAGITGADIAEWRDMRLQEVAPGSVLREMTQLRSVFEACRRDWGVSA